MDRSGTESVIRRRRGRSGVISWMSSARRRGLSGSMRLRYWGGMPAMLAGMPEHELPSTTYYEGLAVLAKPVKSQCHTQEPNG